VATPRVVVVRRATERDELVAAHGTLGQAGFFLSTRGQSLEPVEQRHRATTAALDAVAAAVPADWRRASVERAELSRFVFEPADVVVIVGQDGLVANVAKYLDRQPVIGIDPLPGANAGVLVPHAPADAGRLLRAAVAGSAEVDERTMVEVRLDDGQAIVALNEVFVGQVGHQSARYALEVGGASERQSSSGVIVSTGTGASGWCRSIARIQAPSLQLPAATQRALAWFAREPWPSPSTGAELVAGRLEGDAVLALRVESDALVVFGDGIEADRLQPTWGQRIEVGVAPRTLRTVR
jgi:hypothetical protein